MLTAIRESEENYKKEQEQARIREERLKSARQTSRSDINLYPTLANSTPIRNTAICKDFNFISFVENSNKSNNMTLHVLIQGTVK